MRTENEFSRNTSSAKWFSIFYERRGYGFDLQLQITNISPVPSKGYVYVCQYQSEDAL